MQRNVILYPKPIRKKGIILKEINLDLVLFRINIKELILLRNEIMNFLENIPK